MPEALIVVDVQDAFDDPVWGARSNPACEDNVVALIDPWRRRGEPVVQRWSPASEMVGR